MLNGKLILESLKVLVLSMSTRHKLKILLIAPQPFFTIRGTPLAVRELAFTLIKFGHRVDILTFHLGEDLAGLNIYRTRFLSKIIKSIPPGFSFKKLILDVVLLPKAVFLILKNRYNVVHCVEESAYFISWFKWIKPFLFVYDMDSDIPKQLAESGKIKSWFILRFVKELEKFAVKCADAVVTICPVFTDRIKQKPVFQIEDVSIQDDIPQIKREDHEKRILYTGNFEKYQGVELLINAFEIIKEENTVLVLAGGEKGDKGDGILSIGKRPISEMPSLLQSADILVSPRIKGENTPFKIYSYMASGKPILATNIVSHTQVLTNEMDSLLVSPTVEGIADGLRRLLKDNDLSKRLGEGAKRLFSEKYTKDCYERKVKRYVKYLEEKI